MVIAARRPVRTRLPAGGWRPIEEPAELGTRKDAFNRVTLKPVLTAALRLEVQLQPGWSGGILEWRVEEGEGDP